MTEGAVGGGAEWKDDAVEEPPTSEPAPAEPAADGDQPTAEPAEPEEPEKVLLSPQVSPLLLEDLGVSMDQIATSHSIAFWQPNPSVSRFIPLRPLESLSFTNLFVVSLSGSELGEPGVFDWAFWVSGHSWGCSCAGGDDSARV